MNTEHNNFERGWLENILNGVKVSKIMIEPINPPANTLHNGMLRFKNMAVK